MPDLFSILAANAFKPVDRIRLSGASSFARLMLVALQTLPGRRGVNRI